MFSPASSSAGGKYWEKENYTQFLFCSTDITTTSFITADHVLFFL